MTQSEKTGFKCAAAGLKKTLARMREAVLLKGNLTGTGASYERGKMKPLVDRFSGVLSVQYFDKTRGVFLLNDAGETALTGLGCVFELHPAVATDAQTAGMLERVLSEPFGTGATVSVSLFASAAAVRSTLREYVGARSSGSGTVEVRELFREMACERVRMLDAAARDLAGGAHTSVRHHRVWMAITARPGAGVIAELLKGIEAPEVEAFLRATDAVKAALTTYGLFAYSWRAEDWRATTREILNPHKAADGLLEERSLAGDVHDASGRVRGVQGADAEELAAVPLRRSAVFADTRIDIARDCVRFAQSAGSEAEACALAVTGYPAQTGLARMAALVLGLKGTRIAGPYLLTATVEPTDLESDRSATAVKHARVRQLMGTEIGQFLTDLEVRARDLEIAHKACEEGRGLARITHTLLVYAKPGKAGAAAAAAANALTACGLTAQVDSGLQIMDLIASVPLEAGATLLRDMRTAGRTVTMTREACARMLPVAGVYRGSGARSGKTMRESLLLLLSRSGELIPLDNFANKNGNYNAVVCGMSGAGKSVVSQELVMGTLATGGRVWVFDIGRSYQNCVELAGGQFIAFEKDAGLCMNPLDMAGDDITENLDEIAQIIAVMANGDAPMELTAMELIKLEIEKTVREAKAKGEVATVTKLVMRLLASNDAALHDAAVRLSAFAAGGRFAPWFEGKATVNFDAPLVVLEMEALDNKPVLQGAVLLILIMRILQEVKKGSRSQRRLIVIDEAWRLLSGDAGKFIEWACRTLRKYGAGIVCISQSMEDFNKSGTARAVRMNSDSRFLLKQEDPGIEASTNDPYVRKVLKSLTTNSEVYSEVWAKVGDAPAVVGRLVLDPFSMTAYSTRADVFEAVRKEREKGVDAVTAIRNVSARVK